MTLKTLGLARRAKTTEGQFLYLPGGAGYGPTLLDRPVTVMPDLTEADGATAGLDIVYFGDFRTAFTLVDRTDVVVQRLTERYAETGQLLFIVYRREMGGVVIPEAISRLVTA
jgi:HK97 family phage major capsid protein